MTFTIFIFFFIFASIDRFFGQLRLLFALFCLLFACRLMIFNFLIDLFNIIVWSTYATGVTILFLCILFSHLGLPSFTFLVFWGFMFNIIFTSLLSSWLTQTLGWIGSFILWRLLILVTSFCLLGFLPFSLLLRDKGSKVH